MEGRPVIEDSQLKYSLLRVFTPVFILRMVNKEGLMDRETFSSCAKPGGIHAHTLAFALEYRAGPPWCKML